VVVIEICLDTRIEGFWGSDRVRAAALDCQCGKNVSRGKNLARRTGLFDCLLNDFRVGRESVMETAMNANALTNFGSPDVQSLTITSVSPSPRQHMLSAVNAKSQALT